MTSKQIIKEAFINELKNTPQYQIVLNIKQFILDEIAHPNIQKYVSYNFEKSLTDEDIDIIKMCLIIEFGFSTNNINNDYIGIDMTQFIL